MSFIYICVKLYSTLKKNILNILSYLTPKWLVVLLSYLFSNLIHIQNILNLHMHEWIEKSLQKKKKKT